MMRRSSAWFPTVVVLSLALGACATDPDTVKRASMAKGDKYFAQQQFAEAIIEYRKAVQVDPKFGEARLKLATTYASVGDGRNAGREYARAADLLPADADAQLKAGTFMLIAGQFREAQARASRALAIRPTDVDAQILFANALAGLKDLPGAMTALEKAIEMDSTRASSYADLGALQLVSGNREAAEAAFRRAVTTAPRSPEPHLALANYLWAVNQPDLAHQELEQALALEPRHAVANRAMALFYLLTNKAADAEPYLKTVVEVTKVPATKFFLAEYYVRSARTAEARAILEPLTKDKDTFETATIRLARLDLLDGKAAEATKKLDAVLAKSPHNPQALTLSGRVLLAQDQAGSALRTLEDAIKADAKSFEAQYALGQTYVALGRSPDAVEAFNEALKINPTGHPARLALARVQLGAGRIDDAAQLAGEVVGAEPGNLDARLLLVQALIVKRDLKGADREMRLLLANSPDSAAVQTAAGFVAALKQDVEGSRRAYRRALDADPHAYGALGGLLDIETSRQQYAVARATIEDHLKRTPNDPTVMTLAAQTYFAIGDSDQSEQMLRKVIEAEPGNIQAYGMLGRLYYSQGRLDMARRDFEELTRHQPKSVAAQTMLATVLELQNQVELAKQHYGRALELDPRAPVASNNLAWLNATTSGNLDVALQLAQTAKAQMPNRHEVDDTLGWIYYRKGLSTLAITSLSASVQRQPDNPTYLFHLGMAYAQNGDKVNARATLEKALRTGNNNFEGASEARKMLASLKG